MPKVRIVCICEDCARHARGECTWWSGVTACEEFEQIPPTNADRIRAMSDGELAKFMIRNTCAVYSSPEDCDYSCDGFETCYDSWLDWLQSPAEGGGEDG